MVITAVLPSGVTYQSANGGTYNPGTGILQVSDLISGQNSSASLTVKVNPATNGQAFTLTASITAAVSDPNPSNNTSSVNFTTYPLIKYADMGIKMVVTNVQPVVGEVMQYVITYGNCGPDTATAVQINAPLPSGVTYQSFQGGGSYNASTGVWTIGDVIRGQNATISLTVKVNTGTIAHIYPMTVTVSTTSTDPNPNNNKASASFTTRSQVPGSTALPTYTPTATGLPDPLQCSGSATATTTNTNTATSSPTKTPSNTATKTATNTATKTNTPSLTPSKTATNTC